MSEWPTLSEYSLVRFRNFSMSSRGSFCSELTFEPVSNGLDVARSGTERKSVREVTIEGIMMRER